MNDQKYSNPRDRQTSLSEKIKNIKGTGENAFRELARLLEEELRKTHERRHPSSP